MPKLLRYDPDNDFYKVLGVAPTATLDEIHRTYRQRAKLVHPDLNRDRREWAHDQFQRLNEAHDIIGDPERRIVYDQKRRLYQELHRPGVRSAALAEASRAAWARRHRRQPPALYYVSVGILMFGALPILYYIVASLISGVNRGDVQVVEVPSPTPFMIVAPRGVPTGSRPGSDILPAETFSPRPCTDSRVQITEPRNGDIVHSPFVIRGSAFSEQFRQYYVSYGPTEKMGQIEGGIPKLLQLNIDQVHDNILVPETMTSSLQNIQGDITIRLIVRNKDYKNLPPCDVYIHLNPDSPATEVATSANS